MDTDFSAFSTRVCIFFVNKFILLHIVLAVDYVKKINKPEKFYKQYLRR